MQNHYQPNQPRPKPPPHDGNLSALVHQLELQVLQLQMKVEALEGQPAPPRFAPPAPRTVLYETRRYEFQARLPEVRRVVDFRSLNTTTNELVHIGNFSPAQITYALQKFSRLESPSRKFWKGNTRLYSVALRLFAQAGMIQQHKGSRVWHWAGWPGERRVCAARIAETLSRKN